MKELVEAVRTYGKGIGTDIVKVDMFLNHRLDTNLLVKMGQAFADVFACEKPDLVLTIEASGIAAALTTAMACGNIPVVFAKKSSTRNVTGDVYESTVLGVISPKISTTTVHTIVETVGPEDEPSRFTNITVPIEAIEILTILLPTRMEDSRLS